jgi:hypothetical protein
MIGMPEGVRKLLIAYDVAGYGGRGKRQQLAIQQRLVDVLSYAFSEARVSGYELQEQGDGGLGLLPTGDGVDEPRVIATLITAMEDALGEINADLVAEARIRLRVALDEGTVHRAAHGFTGPAVTGVCRLRDADVVRQALAASGADLVIVVADHLYHDSVADGRARGRVFRQVSVTAKEYSGAAWLYLPTGAGHSAPSAPPPEAASLAQALRTDPRTW